MDCAVCRCKVEQGAVKSLEELDATLREVAGKLNAPTSFLDRMKEEKSELDERLNKLFPFLESEGFKALAECSQRLLATQAVLMSGYSSVLEERIKLAQAVGA